MSLRRTGLGLAALALAIALHGDTHRPTARLDGQVQRDPVSQRPTIEAAFTRESFRPGETATLAPFGRARDVTVRLFRVGDAVGSLAQRDAMRGEQVGPERHFDLIVPARMIRLGLGSDWASGLYYAELTAPARPRRLRAVRARAAAARRAPHRRRAADADLAGVQLPRRRPRRRRRTPGTPRRRSRTAALQRPFENRGVPPHYRIYDEPFLRWLARNRYARRLPQRRASSRTTTGAHARRAATS